MMPERNVALLDRPLSTRSVIASLLLGMQPPKLAARRLVQWCALFGINEGTARDALSRMVERGELASADGVYELAGRVRRRQPAQDWSLAPELAAWSGDWLLGVVSVGRANRRRPKCAARRGPPAAVGRAARRRVDAARQPARAVRHPSTPGRRPTRSALGGEAGPRPIRSTSPTVCSIPERGRRGRERSRITSKPRPSRSIPSTATGSPTRSSSAPPRSHTCAPIRCSPPSSAGPIGPATPCAAAYREYQSTFAATARQWFRAL